MWNVIDINCHEKVVNQWLELKLHTDTQRQNEKEKSWDDIAFPNGINISLHVLLLIKCK